MLPEQRVCGGAFQDRPLTGYGAGHKTRHARLRPHTGGRRRRHRQYSGQPNETIRHRHTLSGAPHRHGQRFRRTARILQQPENSHQTERDGNGSHSRPRQMRRQLLRQRTQRRPLHRHIAENPHRTEKHVRKAGLLHDLIHQLHTGVAEVQINAHIHRCGGDPFRRHVGGILRIQRTHGR